MKNKNKVFWGTSIKTFPWSFSKELDPFERLANSTLLEWYYAKHSDASKSEIELINSINPISCPYCNSKEYLRYGYTNNRIRRYKCKSCNKTFTILTNTIFDSHKIPISEWFEYLIHIFEFHSIKTSSRDNKNSSTTGIYWLKKVFIVLKHYQDDFKVNGDVYLDECFFSVKKFNTITKDGKKLRGISRNKICVVTLVSKDKVIILVEHTSKPSFRSTYNTLSNRIIEGSTLYHDDEKSHSILVDKLKLNNISFSSKELKGLKDKDNPLYPVNHTHFLIKKFMKEHGGYNRDSLQDYMNLISFILNKPDNRYEKLIEFIKLAVCTHKRMTYRSSMSKKHRDLAD